MKRKRVYGLLAWVILFAFSAMMTVKDTHHLFHHHDHCCCGAICVIDGLPLDCHHHHDHSSFLALDSCDDDCAICQFQVVKVQKPSYTAYLCPATTVRKIEVLPFVFYCSVSFGSTNPRAPPVC